MVFAFLNVLGWLLCSETKVCYLFIYVFVMSISVSRMKKKGTLMPTIYSGVLYTMLGVLLLYPSLCWPITPTVITQTVNNKTIYIYKYIYIFVEHLGTRLRRWSIKTLQDFCVIVRNIFFFRVFFMLSTIYLFWLKTPGSRNNLMHDQFCKKVYLFKWCQIA